jgi:hypothetical protein
MNPTYIQLGVGGIFVLLLLQILLPWLLKITGRSNGKQFAKSAGEMDPSFWQKTIHDITEDVMQRAMIQFLRPAVDAQTDVLRDIRTNSTKMLEGIQQLVNAQESSERRDRQ